MNVTMTPRATDYPAALTHFFQEGSTIDTPPALTSWQEADNFPTESDVLGGRSIISWPYNNVQEHLVGDDPIIIDENDSEFALSDHSNFIPSDTDSHVSSYSPDTLPPNQHSNFNTDLDWQNFPVTCNSQGQVILLPPIGFGSMNDRHQARSIFKRSGIDTQAPTTINPATFQNSPSQPRLVGQVRPYPRSSVSPPPPLLPSLNQRECIALSDLNTPYVPIEARAESLLQSRATASALSLRGRSRSAANRGRGRSKDVQIKRERNKVKPYCKATSGRLTSLLTRSPSNASNSDLFVSDRPKRLTSARYNLKDDSDESGESEATDDDAYTPSRSLSPASSPSEYSESRPFQSYHEKKASQVARRKKLSQMSAAGALARMSSSNSTNESTSVDGGNVDTDNFDDSTAAKSNKASLVPISKTSRGRKVPHVSDRMMKKLIADDADDDSIDGGRFRSGSSRQGRGRGRGNHRGRSFVCTVEGCGKCFVRAEHLKRHVKSIHTEDRPHKCPYRGCGKSFSRRDNLGQHVRLHLIGSE